MHPNQHIFIQNICLHDNEFKCLFRVENYSYLLKRIAVGESITSEEFSFNFANSIGKSKWMLSIFINGQYIYETVSPYSGIYLTLLECENEDSHLLANVTFQLKSQIENTSDGYIFVLNNIQFDPRIPAKTWIGEPKFARKAWLKTKNAHKFFKDDTINISFTIEESYLNRYSKEKELEKVSSVITYNKNVCKDLSKSHEIENIEDPDRLKESRRNKRGKNVNGEWIMVSRQKKNEKKATIKDIQFEDSPLLPHLSNSVAVDTKSSIKDKCQRNEENERSRSKLEKLLNFLKHLFFGCCCKKMFRK